MNQIQQLPLLRRLVLLRKQFFDRTQHEGQRRPQLVAHIGKESGFGAVDFGQRFRAAAFRFVGSGVPDSRGNLTGQQIDKTGVGAVVAPVWIRADDKESGWLLLPLLLNGNDRGLFRRLVPIARRPGSQLPLFGN